jgi:hypothetical protein
LVLRDVLDRSNITQSVPEWIYVISIVGGGLAPLLFA